MIKVTVPVTRGTGRGHTKFEELEVPVAAGMSGHTPGPWRYQEGADAYTHIVRASGNRFLCQLAQDTSGVAEADARLISAAPDLLAAAQTVLAGLNARIDAAPSTAKPVFNGIADLHDAIGKATGAAP